MDKGICRIGTYIMQQLVQCQACDCSYFFSDYDIVKLPIQSHVKDPWNRVTFQSKDEAEIVAAKLTIAGYDHVKIISFTSPNQSKHTVAYR